MWNAAHRHPTNVSLFLITGGQPAAITALQRECRELQSSHCGSTSLLGSLLLARIPFSEMVYMVDLLIKKLKETANRQLNKAENSQVEMTATLL